MYDIITIALLVCIAAFYVDLILKLRYLLGWKKYVDSRAYSIFHILYAPIRSFFLTPPYHIILSLTDVHYIRRDVQMW